jgi:membrane protein YqaA with SNARE-associated domain
MAASGKVSAGTEEEKTSLRDLLKFSWVRTSIKLGIILATAGLITIWLLKIFNIVSTPLFSNIGTFFTNYGLAGIFLVTLLAGTLVPLGSPALVAAAALFVEPIPLILVASIGFTLGMTVNYALAYKLGRPYVTKKIPANQLDEISQLWSKWGLTIYVIFGLIPVLPVELLSFICGLLKTQATTFLALSFVPRLIVFTIIVYFGQYIGTWIGA